MTHYNKMSVKLSNLQLNKLKSVVKNTTEVTLRMSSNLTGDDENDFLHKLLITDRQVLNLCELLQIIYPLM